MVSDNIHLTDGRVRNLIFSKKQTFAWFSKLITDLLDLQVSTQLLHACVRFYRIRHRNFHVTCRRLHIANTVAERHSGLQTTRISLKMNQICNSTNKAPTKIFNCWRRSRCAIELNLQFDHNICTDLVPGFQTPVAKVA
jgi:hypothetical protein